MRKDDAARLHGIVKDLERGAEVAAACGLGVATKLLRMAKLELLCQIHEISAAELRAISDRLSRAQPIGENGARHGAPSTVPE